MNEKATERGLSAVTPEVIKPEGRARRNSTGKIVTRDSLSLSNNEGRHLPHVLRASMGSCHDFCKYGIKHAFEAKEKPPFLRKSSGSNATPENKKIGLKSLNLVVRKRKSVIKLTVTSKLPHLKDELADRPKNVGRRATTYVKKNESTREQKIIKRVTPVNTDKLFEEFEIIKQSMRYVKEIVPSEEPEIIKLNTLPVKSNDLFEEPEIIKQMILSPVKVNELSEESETIEQTNPSLVKMNELSVESESREQTIPSPIMKIVASEEPETIKQNTSPAEKNELSEESDTIEETTPSVKKIESSEEPETVKQHTPPLKKIELSVEREIIKQKSPSVKKTLAYTKPNIKQKVPSHIKKTNGSVKRFDASAKPANNLKPRTSAVKSQSPLTTSRGLTGRINSGNKTVKSMGLPKIRERKGSKSPAAPLSPKTPISRESNLKQRKYGNTKSASLVKNQNKSGKAEPSNDQIKENKLFVIKPKPEIINLDTVLPKTSYQSSPSLLSSLLSSLSLSSSPSGSSHEEEEEQHEEFESTSREGSESVYDHKGTEKNQVENLEDKNKKRLRRVAMVHPEDKEQTPYKLKFRRGKVVSIQSENNDPWRLRFRQGRVVGENQNVGGEVARRSFRRRREPVSRDPNNHNAVAPTVVLRHQDMLGKKDTPGLFNLVIEETASKLVEARKSKVKALVGAFETVISLQESKPAATV